MIIDLPSIECALMTVEVMTVKPLSVLMTALIGVHATKMEYVSVTMATMKLIVVSGLPLFSCIHNSRKAQNMDHLINLRPRRIHFAGNLLDRTSRRDVPAHRAQMGGKYSLSSCSTVSTLAK